MTPALVQSLEIRPSLCGEGFYVWNVETRGQYVITETCQCGPFKTEYAAQCYIDERAGS